MLDVNGKNFENKKDYPNSFGNNPFYSQNLELQARAPSTIEPFVRLRTARPT